MKKLIDWFEGRIFDWAIGRIKKKNDEARKHAILSLAVQKLFNMVGPEDILHINERGQWIYRGRPLTDGEITALREEAAVFTKSKLWQVLRLDVKYQLNKKMFEEARVPLDLVWAQLTLFYDDIIRTRLKSLK